MRATRQPERRIGINGFTLIEVLVALSIVAIALAAGARATASLVLSSEHQTRNMLASLCAENALINVRLTKNFPDLGDFTTPCIQARVELSVKLLVEPTPNPSFRRVNALVLQNGAQIISLSTVISKY